MLRRGNGIRSGLGEMEVGVRLEGVVFGLVVGGGWSVVVWGVVMGRVGVGVGRGGWVGGLVVE